MSMRGDFLNEDFKQRSTKNIMPAGAPRSPKGVATQAVKISGAPPNGRELKEFLSTDSQKILCPRGLPVRRRH